MRLFSSLSFPPFLCDLFAVKQTDDKYNYDADTAGNHAVCGNARSRGGKSEVVSHCRTYYHADNCDCRVAVAASRENELSERAAAEECRTPTYDKQAEEVPQPVGVSDRLIFKTEVECTVDEVSDNHSYDNHDERINHLELSEHDGITDTAYEANAETLTHDTYDKSADESCPDRSVHGAGARFAENEKERCCQKQNENEGRRSRCYCAFKQRKVVRAFEGETFVQKDCAYADTCDEAQKTDNRVHIAAADTKYHTQRTTEEDERAYHNCYAENKTCYGSGTAGRFEVFADKGYYKCAEYDTYDFRTEILYDCSRMHSGATCNISQKASDAEAHVLRVSHQSQSQRHQTDDDAGEEVLVIFYYEVFHKTLLKKYRKIAFSYM